MVGDGWNGLLECAGTMDGWNGLVHWYFEWDNGLDGIDFDQHT